MICGMSLAGAAYWPGGVRRKGGVSLICGSCMEWENAGADTADPRQDVRRGEARGSPPDGRTPEVVSTGAARAGGPDRSSWEAPAAWRWGRSQGAGSSGNARSINQPCGLGGTGVSMPRSPQDKPFRIPKGAVWQAYEKVKRNQGAPGVGGQSLAEFETGLQGNLYRIWNRMSSGTYFPCGTLTSMAARHRGQRRGSRVFGGAVKVPAVRPYFWVVKLLTTAMGEAVSDFVVLDVN